jgi:integrase
MLAVCETPAAWAPRPRLLDRVREAIRARHYSRRTEKAYVGWIKRYIFFHGKRHPADMGGAEVTRFLTTLAVDGRVSASTQNQALPIHLPVVLTRDEVCRVLASVNGPSRLIVLLLYGAGLRLLEAAQLRVKDVDVATNQIVIRNGKGAKDRVTMLPLVAKARLIEQIDVVRRQHREDLSRDAGWVALPDALARKYPNAGRELGWQWVFPATRHYVVASAASAAATICTSPSSSARSSGRCARPKSPRPPAATRSVTRLPLTCSRTVTTFALSRSCSGIATSARP